MRQNGGGISHFRCAETTSFRRPNRCAPKFSKIIPRIRHDQLKRVFYVTRSYAAAGISRYRLINVAPIIGSLSGTKKFGYPVVQLCRGSNLSVPCFWVHKVILSVPLAWNIFSPWLDLTDDGASALLTSSLQHFHRASVILLISNSRPWTSLLILTVIYSFVGILCIILWLS